MAPRARNATLTFGLVTMSVKLTSAKDEPVAMKNLCVGQPGMPDHAPKPVKQPNVCEACGPVAYDEIVKGLPDGDGFILQSQEEVAEVKAEYAEQYKKSLNFVPHPTHEIMALTGPGKSLNYIAPAEVSGENIYRMLLQLVIDRPGITLATLHTPVSATSLFILTARNGALALEQRTRTENLREAPVVGGTVNDSLYGMLVASAEAMTTPYNPEDYEDGYQKHLVALAEQYATVTSITPATPVADTEVDLRLKLQAMMEGAA
jgi:non-homologous end joining protein Ku